MILELWICKDIPDSKKVVKVQTCSNPLLYKSTVQPSMPNYKWIIRCKKKFPKTLSEISWPNHEVGNGRNSPRPYQQTPGAYPKPPTNSLWRNSFHLGVWGCLGYAPGVCWVSLRNSLYQNLYPPWNNSLTLSKFAPEKWMLGRLCFPFWFRPMFKGELLVSERGIKSYNSQISYTLLTWKLKITHMEAKNHPHGS